MFTEKRIPKKKAGSVKTWFVPVLGNSGAVVSSHEKQMKEGRAERIENLEAYVHNGYISAEVLEQLHQQIYEDARAKAEADGYQVGYEKGFLVGKNAGEESGYQAGEDRIEEAVAALHALLTNMLSPLKDYDKKLELWIYQTVKQISLGILRREFSVDTTLLLPLVHEVVAAMPAGDKTIEIHVCPDDLALLDQYTDGKQLPWHLNADNSLARGDCRVKSSASQIDYTLVGRVEGLLEILTADHPEHSASEQEQHVSLPH